MTDLRQDSPPLGKGVTLGLGAYGLWGLLPLYFVLLLPASPVEIVANRVLWSLLFCMLLLSVTRSWGALLAALHSPRTLAALSLAALLIVGNWLTYTYGVTSGQATEAALGYFINPLISVLLGVLILKERLRPLQWVALGIGFVAVIQLTVAYGRLPWIALVLALTFGFYGFTKNRLGSRTTAITSLSVETAVLAPIAAVLMLLLAQSGTATLTSQGTAHFWWMASSGLVTAIPLLLFGAAARRLPLVSIGLLQYFSPVLQFLVAVLILKEQMGLERWIGFGIVWLALIVLTVDLLASMRRNRVLRRAEQMPQQAEQTEP
ncbi:EamA family transporter RarD [Acaricomes phytoseiuli]|uniref:EamA family transporter RarD n=1 Tax=Acaricomes phytoseiuli TaxID=291968 RepID=UPI0003740F1C|nr:EamA family transporter RarD [Acaricomes phytoseiuli]MCW1248933.1 EamA family transporter RarD [Acaricomes phytoseiuli]